MALDGHAFTFKAGQWAMLGEPQAAGKPYSIASAPREAASTGALAFLIRDEGSGTGLARLRRGAAVHVDGPHGRFLLPDPFTGDLALFVAGGTGIAPLRAMLAELLARPHRPECGVLYSARSANEFAFARELRTLARQRRIRLALAVTRDLQNGWKGLSGRIGRAHLAEFIEGRDSQAFVCGPEGFVRDVRDALADLGVQRIRIEEQ